MDFAPNPLKLTDFPLTAIVFTSILGAILESLGKILQFLWKKKKERKKALSLVADFSSSSQGTSLARKTIIIPIL